MMLQGFKSDLLFICAWSLAFQILEKGKIFVLRRVEGRYYSHRKIYYDFCIAGQERET